MRKAFLLSLFVSLNFCLMAVPAKRGVWKTVTLADGTKVKVELRGDEFMNFWQAENGKKYVHSAESLHFVEADMEKLEAKAFAARRNAPLPSFNKSATRVDMGGDHPAFIGEKKGLIILAEFTDSKFQPGHDSIYYSHVANDLNFTHEDGFVGSIRDYFLDQSNGLFDLTFDVVGPIELAHDVAYYGAPTSSGDSDSRVPEMVKEAATAAAAILPSFEPYDWFGDGYVDQVFVIYAGRGESDGGGENTIWPHRWELWPRPLEAGGKKVKVYACSNELQQGPNGTEVIDGIGAFCHEFSHCLGLPDLYDLSYNNYGMGYWDIMDVGCYLGNSYRPCGYSGYERNYCGWKEPIILTQDTVVTGMKGIAEGGDYFIIYNDGHPDEYYVLENRVRKGWDADLYGSGLLITHIDYDQRAWLYNEVNSSANKKSHPHYTPFLADNSEKMNTAKQIEGDLYPYNKNDSLTNKSVPAAILYNENLYGDLVMNKPITNIKRNFGNTISFLFSNRNTPEDIAASIILNENDATASDIFTLDGRRVGNDMGKLSPGIYIQNGKKVVK